VGGAAVRALFNIRSPAGRQCAPERVQRPAQHQEERSVRTKVVLTPMPAHWETIRAELVQRLDQHQGDHHRPHKGSAGTCARPAG
jgi:hypothetical protein